MNIYKNKIVRVLGINFLRYFSKYISNERYLKMMFPLRTGYKLDLKNPVTFNQKLQWLKLYDQNPIYTTMVDKVEAKGFVEHIIGAGYTIPTISVYNDVNEIDFSKLPNQFVLKTTHDSGGVVVCKDKSKLNTVAAIEKLKRSMERDYYLWAREFPYKDVKHRILAEEFIADLGDNDVKDYKVHCFNGEPKFILVCSDRFSATGLKEDFYDTEWNHLPIRRKKHGNSEKVNEKPEALDKVLEQSRQLSKGAPFLRTDFYIIGDKIYFGELTFFPASGMEPFIPEEWDYKFGEMLKVKSL